MTIDNVQNIDVNVQNKYNDCTRGINMIEVTISEFRKNLKKYSKMLEKDSIMVFNNGKPIMKVEHPNIDKLRLLESLRGCVPDDGRDYDDIKKEYMSERYGIKL